MCDLNKKKLQDGKSYEINALSRLKQFDELFYSIEELEEFLFKMGNPKDVRVTAYPSYGENTYSYRRGIRLT